MFCKRCGKNIPDGSDFCQHCGTNQNSSIPPEATQSKDSKSNSNGIFQKKIIIGSIIGFAASAIGIIGVFFPNLLNIEKKRIEELAITINEQKDANDLYRFLKNNEHKIVKLEIKYSPKKIQNSEYKESWRDNLFKAAEKKNLLLDGYPHSKTIVTYPIYKYSDVESDDYVEPEVDIIDVATNKLLPSNSFDTKNLPETKYGLSSQDPSLLTDTNPPDFGILKNGIWYCHIMDIYCNQNLFKKTATKYLYSLPNYPYPIFVAPIDYENYNLLYINNIKLDTQNMFDENGYLNLESDETDFDVSQILINESVLFGKSLSNLAHHYNSKYVDGIANIDKGTLSFLTDLTDNELKPVYILGDLAENKNLKILNVFNNNGLVDIFTSPEQRVEVLDNGYELLTTSIAVLDNNNNFVTTNSTKENLGQFYNASQQELKNSPFLQIATNNSFNNSYAIEIPYSTKNNTLYTWKSTSLKSRYPKIEDNDFSFKDNNETITLSGHFYVHAENDSELELHAELPYFHCELIEYYSRLYVDVKQKPCVVQKVFKLEPLGKKELEQRNY